MQRWAVPWDVVGLVEKWLDEESEKGLAMNGYGALCASRKRKRDGGVALMTDLHTGLGQTWVPLMMC